MVLPNEGAKPSANPKPMEKSPGDAVDEITLLIGGFALDISPEGTKLRGSKEVWFKSKPKRSWFDMVEEDEANLRCHSAPVVATGSDHTADKSGFGSDVLPFLAGKENEPLINIVEKPRCATATKLLADFNAVADTVMSPSPSKLSATASGNSFTKALSVVEFRPSLNRDSNSLSLSGGMMSDSSPCTKLSCPVASNSLEKPCASNDRGTTSNRSSRTILSSGSPRGTGVFLGGRYSQADVIAFGGISLEASVGVRSSDRIRAQPHADDTQLERAQRIAMAKDNISSPGSKFISKYSLISFPTEVVVERASKLGVSLGKSPSEIANSVNRIKDTDVQRTLTILKRNEEKANEEANVSRTMLLDKAMDLSDDLMMEEHNGLDKCLEPPMPITKTKRSYRKRDLANTVIRRSVRLKNKN
jgi:hypothetical protein